MENPERQDDERQSQEYDEVTKVTYLDGKPKEIFIRKGKLEVIEDPDKGKVLSIDRNTIRVGSKDTNDLPLTDGTVSRHHFEIEQLKNGYLLRDLDSTNGTYVEGLKVREVFLKPNSTIQVGDTAIRFYSADEKVKIVPSKEEKFGDMVGRSTKMREIFGLLEKIAPTDVTCVIMGETGTGKELVAKAIHYNSRRAKKPFIVFDCGSVPPTLIESELFGHEKGSFTGAVMSRPGVFELADGGTIFLDEMGELGIDMQPKLLRVLEQRETRRVGANRSTKVDVRVIAATNRDLKEEVRQGRFREDLFFRLSVVSLTLPSLRERKDDIVPIIKHILGKSAFNKNKDGQQKVTGIAPDAEPIMMGYDWPGNVRELHNVVERAVSFCEGDTIHAKDLPDHMRAGGGGGASASGLQEIPHVDSSLPFKDAKEKLLDAFEREYLIDLLRRNDKNISKAAKEAEIDRKSISRLLKKHGIKLGEI